MCQWSLGSSTEIHLLLFSQGLTWELHCSHCSAWGFHKHILISCVITSTVGYSCSWLACRAGTMKLKHLISFCDQYSINLSWEWQMHVMHSDQRDLESFHIPLAEQWPDLYVMAVEENAFSRFATLRNTSKWLNNIQIWWQAMGDVQLHF